MASPAALSALRHYELRSPGEAAPPPDEVRVQPLGAGLINQTFLVEAGPHRAVLQRVNPIFGIAVHEDIEAVTAHLARQGLVTPRLYRTRTSALAVDLDAEDDPGLARPAGVWRLMTFLPSVTHLQMAPRLAAAAGALVGRFHAHLLDLDHTFRFSRPGAHDLRKHEATLRTALARARTEPDTIPDLPAGFPALAEETLAILATLPTEMPGPLRVCHGDLKLSNLLFAEAAAAAAPTGLALVDLDTLGRLPLGLELGDALRSWCNLRSEDDPAGEFSLDLLERALRGYAEWGRRFVTPVEAAAIVPGVIRIATQLAARFGADVVNQSYFGWNPARHPSRAAHNFVRAQGQLSLARSLLIQRGEAEAVAQGLLRTSG